MTLPVSEIFTSVQGEGPRAGRVCTFIRLGGCNLSCSWCMDPETPVLMADWSEKPIRHVLVGELVMSYRNRRYESARVEKTMSRYMDERVTVVTDDGEVTCTPDHVFATPHHIDTGHGVRRCRADELEGRHVRTVRSKGWAPDSDVRTDGWWTGWAQGLILGDGHVGAGRYPKVWLRVCDQELAAAYCGLVNRLGEDLRVTRPVTVCEQKRKTVTGRTVYSVAHMVSRVPWVVGLPEDPDEAAGFLAGFFDAEGSVGRNQITISQRDDKTLDRVAGMIRSLGVACTLRYGTSAKSVGTVVINGAANVDAFMRLTRPVLNRKTRKRQLVANRMLTPARVNTVKEATPGWVVNLTTSTGFFFAGGMLVEQCDSGYTWNAAQYNLRDELTATSVEDIIAQVPGDVEEVVITGGEPMMHQENQDWARLLRMLGGLRKFLCVETNGTIVPNQVTTTFMQHYSISPKLPNAGKHKRSQSPELGAWPIHLRTSGSRNMTACLKFVVEDAVDVALACQVALDHGWMRSNVWVMPEGTHTDVLLKRWPEICTAAIEHRINATQRLHVLAYGDTRGT